MAGAVEQVVEQIRGKILNGDWRPGSRLPARTVLIQELDSCANTVQEAVNRLAAEGFLKVGARKKGTQVVENPPHLSRYRLIFPFGPDDWGQFWHAIEAAATQRTSATREFSCFYGLSGHRDIDEYQQVVNEVQTKSVAGLIFASSANELAGTPLLETPGLPRVAIAAEYDLPGVPKVHVDLESFLRRATEFLFKQGKRRFAILCGSRAGGILDMFQRVLDEYDLVSHRHWQQFASLKNPMAARHVMELLFHQGQSVCPDALIIADDNLITSATDGIASSGTRVPEDLSVVAMTNFPNMLSASVPVTRIGFDVPGMLDILTLRLKQLRQGVTPPEATSMPAIFEEDFLRTQNTNA